MDEKRFKILDNRGTARVSAKRDDVQELDDAWFFLCQILDLKAAQVGRLAVLMLAVDCGFKPGHRASPDALVAMGGGERK